MLYYLLYGMSDYFSVLNVFRYLTFRSMTVFIFVLLAVLIFQPRFIEWLSKKQFGQPIRNDGPESHLSKKGTPTMGGVVVIGSIIAGTLLFADILNVYVWVVTGVCLSYAVLGFMDDFSKVKGQSSRGLSPRQKLVWQFLTALVAVSLLVAFAPNFSTAVSLPFFKNAALDLSYWYIPFAMLVIVGSSNAVNLTDGLDGLVAGPVMTVAFAYGVFAYVAGHAKIADYLNIAHLVGTGDLSIVAAAIVAGGLGFLWYNTYPAQVFMGDVGSLALGGALGTLAICTKQELILVLAGAVFVVEALSVIIQVSYFKMTGKRVFRMAPIHHHFELKGIPEPKIIVRCWIISIVLAILAIASLKLR